jgi:S-adenosylmethionine-diacylglycerol 3-amino-3-carboxypropyl transferase
MEALFNYGISQEDVLSEYQALDISRNDSILCIASAGEIPLNLAALQHVSIVAVDNSAHQLSLCRIKQLAATCLNSSKAASFLGYMDMPGAERSAIYLKDIRPLLSEEDRHFMDRYSLIVQEGLINAGRFEKYIRRFSALGRHVIGKKNLYRLFECDSVAEQQEIFDNHISGLLLKGIFKTAFHPTIYKKRGIDPMGLTHSGTRNIADFFYQRFRNFCCSTPSRKNYYLQYTFFNRVLFAEALPEFLQPALYDSFIKNSVRIEFRQDSFEATLEQAVKGQFNKIHLSNIGDWMSTASMAVLFSLIRDRTVPGARAVLRYIHMNHLIPATVKELHANYKLGEDIVHTDRYPFYSIVPIIRQ